MRIPNTKRKKALIVVDLQPAFLRPHNQFIVENIMTLIKNVSYDAYVEAVFAAEKGSIWDIQQEWVSPKDSQTKTVDEVHNLLSKHNALQVFKSTRSAFNGDKDIAKHLNESAIEEVHIVGTETNDCVLATVFAAFDAGFIPYVIEECCESATEGRHQMGIDILRIQGMSNNRCLANTIDVG